jgi:hypothetical protein
MRKANPRLISVQVTKAGGKKKEVYHYADDSETIICVVGDIFLIDSRPAHAVGLGSTDDPGAKKYGDDFYDLDWVNKAEYNGHQDYQGISCCTYYQKGAEGTDEMTAYIDVKTRLPVAVQNSQATLSYTFRSSTDAVELPARLVTKLNEALQARHQLQ